MSSEDIAEIRALTDRYSDAANRCSAPDMAAGYAEAAELVAFGARFTSRPAIEAVFAQTIGLMDFMNQICSGGVIEVDGETASARWTVTEFSKRKASDKLEIFMGTYQDRLVKGPDGWQFQQRILTRRAQAKLDGDLRTLGE